jgi:hypothetical protein
MSELGGLYHALMRNGLLRGLQISTQISTQDHRNLNPSAHRRNVSLEYKQPLHPQIYYNSFIAKTSISESDNISRSSSICLKRLLIFKLAILSPLRFLILCKQESFLPSESDTLLFIDEFVSLRPEA